MDVLMYLRKSRAEEMHDTTEETLRRHKEQLLAVAKRMGLHIIMTFEEVKSGESLYARPQCLAMLEAVSTGNYDAVLCMDVDRLGRGSMAEQGIIFDTFRRFGVKIITPDSVIDPTNDDDAEKFEFESLFARRELKTYKKRMRRGIAKSIDEGSYLANAPYGYNKTVVNRQPTLEINEEEAFFVRMIFDMYVNQRAGTPTIAEHISALGAHPARSDKFNRTTISFIIKNPVYIGKTVWNRHKHVTENGLRHSYPTPEKLKITDGIHPPIIDEETFNAAQLIMKKQWHKKYFDGTVQNPLAGLVRCGNCGRTMMRHPSGARTKIPFLLCQTKGCMPTHPIDEVEAAVLANIREQLAALDLNIKDSKAPDVSQYDRSIEAAEKELKGIASQITKIHELLEQGVYDIETFLDRRDSLNERTEYLKKHIIEEQERRQAVLDSDLFAASAKIHSVLDIYEASDPAKRNELLRSIIDYIIYNKEKRGSENPFSIFVKLSFPLT